MRSIPSLTIRKMINARKNDYKQGDNFRGRESVLHFGGPLYIPAVDER